MVLLVVTMAMGPAARNIVLYMSSSAAGFCDLRVFFLLFFLFPCTVTSMGARARVVTDWAVDGWIPC